MAKSILCGCLFFYHQLFPANLCRTVAPVKRIIVQREMQIKSLNFIQVLQHFNVFYQMTNNEFYICWRPSFIFVYERDYA